MGHGLDSLQSFCGCLLERKRIDISPLHGVAKPGGGGPLPSFLGRDRVGGLLSSASFNRKFGNYQSHLVVRVFCTANVHLSRLVNLSSGSISFSTSLLGMAKGEGGRHLVPFNSRLGRAVLRCISVEGRVVSKESSTFFMERGNRQLCGGLICGLIGQGLSGIMALGGHDPRILERAFTAAVLGGSTRLNTIGRLLNRDDLTAARVCARAAFRRLGGICGRTRPQTWGEEWM